MFDVAQCVDLHCHCLAGFDDGPATMGEAIELCRALAADGCTMAIATPHQLGRYDGRSRPAAIRAAVTELNLALQDEGLPLHVQPGAEVRLDERIAELIGRDEVMTLADGGKYVLLELPSHVPVAIELLVAELAAAGVRVIVTHPERCGPLIANPCRVESLLEAGALLQITAASLMGGFGRTASQAAWSWLARGYIAIVASDAHDVQQRRPAMSQALAVVSSRLGLALARQLCLVNPLRVVEGADVTCTLPESNLSEVG